MRGLISLLVLLIVSLLVHKGPANQSSGLIDVSWPNCGKYVPASDVGIIGVTGGLNFHKNPCISQQASKFKTISVYVNTGYPGKDKAKKYANSPKHCTLSDEACLAYNYGYQAAQYAANYTLLSAITPNFWWLDVEFANSWSDNANINRAALTGMQDASARLVGQDNIGYYSYPFQWGIITNNWHNYYPAWVATGSTKRAAALNACGQSFTGGPVVMTQYTKTFDQNIICK